MAIPQITINELNDRIASADKVVVSFNPGINAKTRAGSYVRTRKGLSSKLYFVGRDLQHATDIVEVLE